MTKQEKARRRNFTKARLIGFNTGLAGLYTTDAEKIVLERIGKEIDLILDLWDTESLKLEVNSGQRKRCIECWKYRKLNTDNLCKQCSKEYE